MSPARTTKNRLERLARLVDAALERRLPRNGQGTGIVPAAMRYGVFSGGKRFRPLLALGGCEAVGAPAARALGVASAVELLHTYSLVHDDLPAMDDAATRRGRPSCHRKFGEANAILAGDALITLAFELLGSNGTLNSLEIVRVLGRACGTVGLIGGQALDLEAILRPRRATGAALRDVARRKTAALITASVVAGALAGGATAAKRRRLERFGQDLGLAFQLIDDVHDRDGLAQALGAQAAGAEARRLIARAMASLAPFGRRAGTLRELTTMLAERV